MTRNTLYGVLLGIGGIFAIGVAMALKSMPVPMGGDGTPLPAPVIDFPTLFGGGGLVSMIGGVITFGRNLWPQLTAAAKKVNPNPLNIPTDTAEVVQAVLGYAANRTDERAKRRFVVAVLSEMSDVVAIDNVEVAKALAVLGQVTMATWLPGPTDQTSGKGGVM